MTQLAQQCLPKSNITFSEREGTLVCIARYNNVDYRVVLIVLLSDDYMSLLSVHTIYGCVWICTRLGSVVVLIYKTR